MTGFVVMDIDGDDTSMMTPGILSVRTNAALSRLASLRRRAEGLAPAAAAVVKAALEELSDALEYLQAAGDQLEAQAAEAGTARAEALGAAQRFDHLLQVLPCACVWTTRDGEISEANPAAAALLNVSSPHLVGRPLVLFLTDRAAFQHMLKALAGGSVDDAEIECEVRPRERRSRPVRVAGRRFPAEEQLCWFLLDSAAPR